MTFVLACMENLVKKDFGEQMAKEQTYKENEILSFNAQATQKHNRNLKQKLTLLALKRDNNFFATNFWPIETFMQTFGYDSSGNRKKTIGFGNVNESLNHENIENHF